jgi:hypothetical protein
MVEKKTLGRAKLTKKFQGTERRAFVRYSCTHNISCRPIQSEGMDRWPAMIDDISLNGLSLVICRPFAKGEILALELPNAPESFRRRLFVRVIHAQAQPGDVWVVGCRFIHRLTDYELEALV